MRYIKLNISLFIGLVGLVFYFLTVPAIDAEKFMSIDVESGDEKVFDDLYLGGSLDYNSNIHSSFIYQDNQINIHEELPILKKLDEPSFPKEKVLLDQYPEFISDINSDINIIDSQFLDSKDYVVSSFFKTAEKDYNIDLKQLNLQILNKDTDEIESDEISRTENVKGDFSNIFSIQEEFPIVRVLFSITDWGSHNSEEVSTLLLGEYNFETKNYSEEVIKKADGDFQLDDNQDFVSDNRTQTLLTFYPSGNATEAEGHIDEVTDTDSDEQTLLANLVDSEVTQLDGNKKYLTTENNELFSLEFENNSEALNKYDAQGEEIVDKIPLDITGDVDPLDSEQLLISNIIDDKLFIFQSNMPMNNRGLDPTEFQVFDIQTGEEISAGEIKFDSKELSASEVFISEIGKN